MVMSFAGKTAIAGIGATDFSKNSGRSTLRLAVEACELAMKDAGVTPDMIDGMVTYAHDNNNEIDVCRSLGVDKLTHFSLVHHSGGAACGVVHQAAMAVASGACNYCLVWRAFNERSEERFGAGVQERPPAPTPMEVDFGWSSPFGLLTPASWVAMFAQRYMHEYGATSEDFGAKIVSWLHNTYFRAYTTDDIVGAQLGGACKNVLAIAAGISDGLGYGANARAALITRGLAEMARLGLALGGRQESFMGLSGLGDLVLTATGDLSRNRKVGLLLAEGKTLQDAVQSLGHVAEGVYSARTVLQRALHLGVDMPITECVVALLDGELKPVEAVAALMGRDPKGELL